MTDELELIDEEKLMEEARKVADILPDKIPDASALPDDVPDGTIED